jgi:hypothetical protein
VRSLGKGARLLVYAGMVIGDLATLSWSGLVGQVALVVSAAVVAFQAYYGLEHRESASEQRALLGRGPNDDLGLGITDPADLWVAVVLLVAGTTPRVQRPASGLRFLPAG